ncbi:TetR/AcrR family transcriptional regulator [Lachnobacterium bovis]|uniref:Transcriptional regulator, TetR family n=1 Tax=Lachnobacterium bovis TaxID=140626 RepID=A0A1H9TWB1_9FIRM|nr:TetR/AcrR family transcriptional regulator [Lachnobacterium bovis]SES01288.1 transcriptional regulator, TetR family [Lachnobacterium bovis]
MRWKYKESELREFILDTTIQLFKLKGLKFTMDELAKEMGISKKTIYRVFPDKKTMFYRMVDFFFDKIKSEEEEILKNDKLSTVDKIRAILGVMPEEYKDIDFSALYIVRDKYPKSYERIVERLETGWDNTIKLINQGIKEGVVRPIDVTVVKAMLSATIEQFFQKDILVRNDMSYPEALASVVDIICCGIIIK